MLGDLEERIDRVLDGARDHGQVMRGLVELLGHTVPALGIMHYRYGTDGFTALSGTLGERIRAEDRPVLNVERDPCQRAASRLPPRPRIVHATRLISPREFYSSAAWAEFYRRHEMENMTCVWLTSRKYAEPGFAGILIARSKRHPEFARDEFECIERILPTLVAATNAMEGSSEPSADEEDATVEISFDSAGWRLSAAARAELARRRIDAAWLVEEALRRLRATPSLADVMPSLRARSLRWPCRRLVLAHPTRRATVEVSVRWRPESGAGLLRLEPEGRSICTRQLAVLGLTAAEIAVLQGLADGLSTEEVGQLLFLSTETVRTHIKRILQKLGLTSRVQAALLMQRLLLADPD